MAIAVDAHGLMLCIRCAVAHDTAIDGDAARAAAVGMPISRFSLRRGVMLRSGVNEKLALRAGDTRDMGLGMAAPACNGGMPGDLCQCRAR